MWKRSKLLLLLLCPLLLMAQAKDGYEESETVQSGQSPEPTIYEQDEASQQKYEAEAPPGHQIDRKALEERVRKLDYQEKQKERKVEDPDRNKKKPDFGGKKISLPNGQVFKTVMFVIAFALLLGLIIYLFYKSGGKVRQTQKQGLAGLAEWEEAWNLDADAADNALQDAIEAGNYRMAVRWLYLRNLRMIIDKELVKPSPEKTNLQYAAELAKVALQELFSKTTAVYETVWYGEAIPDRQAYQRVSPWFQDMYERTRKL